MTRTTRTTLIDEHIVDLFHHWLSLNSHIKCCVPQSNPSNSAVWSHLNLNWPIRQNITSSTKRIPIDSNLPVSHSIPWRIRQHRTRFLLVRFGIAMLLSDMLSVWHVMVMTMWRRADIYASRWTDYDCPCSIATSNATQMQYIVLLIDGIRWFCTCLSRRDCLYSFVSNLMTSS